MVGMQPLLVAIPGTEAHFALFIARAAPGFQHLQAFPAAVGLLGRQLLGAERRPVIRMPAVQYIIPAPLSIGTKARAHQLLGGDGASYSIQKGSATIGKGLAALAGTEGHGGYLKAKWGEEL